MTLSGGGAWSETGRTDGDTDSQGGYSEPLTVPITDPSFGSPPAGMHGPYLQLAETGDNDGDWNLRLQRSGRRLGADAAPVRALARNGPPLGEPRDHHQARPQQVSD